jgi:hypothetical protein
MQIIAALFLLAFVIAMPVWLVMFIRNPYRAMHSDKGSGASGAVLQEIDRLIARPSVEHQVELENKVHERDDNIGGQ